MKTQNQRLLDYDTANEYFDYRADTGYIYWKKNPSNKNLIGEVAGNVTLNGYIKISFRNKNYYAHRLAWLLSFGSFPSQIDHKNHIRTDNRLRNLRSATRDENMKNCVLHKDNKSGIAGVRFNGAKWVANIGLNGSQLYLGCFDGLLEAACARISAQNDFGYHKNHGRV